MADTKTVIIQIKTDITRVTLKNIITLNFCEIKTQISDGYKGECK